MPALLKRIAFEVNGSLLEETNTITSESTDGHYISLRPLLHPTKEQTAFPFEWAFAGTNKDITVSKVSEDTVKEDFLFGFDSNKYLHIPNQHEGPVETYWKTIHNGVREETGEIFPMGKAQPGVKFMEMWQPIDFSKQDLVITDGSVTKGRSVTLKIDTAEYFGLIIVVGQWIQGFLSKKGQHSTEGLSFIRAFETSQGTVNTLVKYGSDFSKFPTLFDALSVGTVVDANGASWETLEAHY
ncbi:similar to Saccharomyces cerevisiae YLR301W HRI1 Protein of unknown function that interacts with Sec72p and Hrr25p [Maudiozyma saulgeensis]|uniref:Protein HRI1 n=1 Tax=Maudiozyma saulgeensis TaxID=1789683 RepID=A0A1X7R7N3_9SACH|nr:similar to Saccharomyces cerevisiae YLR301W HRI1 Protein of unknown function that interacts with Sec72p and Hrr25p [Kazachstania saulgeensis]